jgi:hypothetical protein
MFPSCKTLNEKVLPCMMKLPLGFVLPYVNAIVSVIATFDLWMSRGAFDTFSFMNFFLTLDWEPKHVTFEAKNVIKINLVYQLQPSLFEEYKLINKIICYVKNESIIYLQ